MKKVKATVCPIFEPLNYGEQMKGCSMLYGAEAILAYTVSEACAIARIGRTSLYKAIRNGELRAIKLGRRTLILPADLKSWLESSPNIVPGGSKGAKAQHVRDHLRVRPDTTQSSSSKP
jgi:excisionase family DNA binding protein